MLLKKTQQLGKPNLARTWQLRQRNPKKLARTWHLCPKKLQPWKKVSPHKLMNKMPPSKPSQTFKTRKRRILKPSSSKRFKPDNQMGRKAWTSLKSKFWPALPLTWRSNNQLLNLKENLLAHSLLKRSNAKMRMLD